MEEQTLRTLSQILIGLKALMRSTEKSYRMGTYQGSADSAVRSFTTIQTKVKELLPDDFYLTEVINLDIPPQADDVHKLNQVIMQGNQMLEYLDNLVRQQGDGSAAVGFSGDFAELRNLGRDLQDQIMTLTKTTLRRALSNIDVGVPPEPPVPPVPPVPGSHPTRGIRIEIHGDDDEPDPNRRHDDPKPV